MAWNYEGFDQRLQQKQTATEEELGMYMTLQGKHFMKLGDDEFIPLDLEDEKDQLDSEELMDSQQNIICWDDENNQPDCETIPDSVDHRQDQTGIRNQLDRGTCVCFASLACLESILKRDDQDIDLSEQYANWLYMREQGRNQCDDGLRTTLSARYLSQYGVCEEQYLPYEDLATVNQHCHESPSVQVQGNAHYGIGQSNIINRLGFRGPSISNPTYLECVLSNGFDIVFGVHVAWGHPDRNGVHDIILDQYGNPFQSRGGHAMLLVGYNNTAPIPYFIFKNSWGPHWGNNGYSYLSYDYVVQYAKYGYIVHQIRTDMVNGNNVA